VDAALERKSRRLKKETAIKMATAANEIAGFPETFKKITEEIKVVIVGLEDVIEGVLVCVMAGGHALLEGVPGLGKTRLISTLVDCVDLEFSRIQFTPDLMPADIRGTNLVSEDESGRRVFVFQKGPIFANVVLADEINRATPKTQSALLDAMQEKTVTVGDSTHRLREPFFVLATQNPIEMEGTYPLPEAQMDRFFFKLLVRSPSLDQLSEIVNRTTGVAEPQAAKVADAETIMRLRTVAREVPVASHVQEYAMKVVLASHPGSDLAPDDVRKYVRYGASPRAAQALILAGKIWALLGHRYNVAYEDIKRAAHPALRHRILTTFEAQAEGVQTDSLVDSILERLAPAEVSVPG
jgi:MoxR-like ATPase